MRRPPGVLAEPVTEVLPLHQPLPTGASAAVSLERALTRFGVEHDIKVCPNPGADHRFINDHDSADMTFLLIVLSEIPGIR